MALTQRFTAVVTGRVQGVSFRYYTRQEAQRLQLSGWVANLPDGRVQVVAEGPPDALQALIDYLHHGPPAARVHNVALAWQAATYEFTNFDVRWL
ncbi:MAG: acylphosphatase [Ardenticatenaceae bacterium]|nr:acylphosphatase [Ardenticatenaceae bacterium]